MSAISTQNIHSTCSWRFPATTQRSTCKQYIPATILPRKHTIIPRPHQNEFTPRKTVSRLHDATTNNITSVLHRVHDYVTRGYSVYISRLTSKHNVTAISVLAEISGRNMVFLQFEGGFNVIILFPSYMLTRWNNK